MKQRRWIALAATVILTLQSTAWAEVLGTVIGGYETDMGAGTVFYNRIYQSDQSSVGKQTEYYYEYKPNTDAVPVVVNGDALYGKRNIKQAAEYLEKNGMRPLLGVNADYFSFKTGIPMGHTIIDGQVVSKDFTGQNGVGFRGDGTGFISYLEIETKITKEDGSGSIVDSINRWCQPGAAEIYILTDLFGATTKTSQTCYYAIMSPVEGAMKLGEDFKLRVGEFFEYTGEIAVPDGKYVLAADKENCEWFKKEFVKSLQVGDVVTVRNEAVYDKELWHSAEQGLSSVGGRLIENGVVNTNFEAGSAPRTAVGIKADGTIVFYVLDGRQKGYSYGAQIKTIARRMAELGCVDAINLDGGGSTSIGGIMPGTGSFALLNKPSEGSMRSCANFLFLKDLRKPTGIGKLIKTTKPEATNYLSGSTAQLTVQEVWDTGNYKIESPAYEYAIDTDTASTVDSAGNISLKGTGRASVSVTAGEAADSITLDVFETPGEIQAYSQNGEPVNEIVLSKNQDFTMQLTPKAYLNGVELVSDPGCYTWSIQGGVGTVDNSGLFRADTQKTGVGAVVITAGDCTREVRILIKEESVFADAKGHWAEIYLTELAKDGVIKGIERDGALYYAPDQQMTRAEFSSLIANFIGIDIAQYSHSPLPFADRGDFDPWMENYAKAMYDLEIMQGRSTDRGIVFAPKDPVTRAEAMTILGRLMREDAPGAELSFTDRDQIPEWAADGIGKLLYAGVVQGYSDGTILPNRNVNRAEAAVMIYHYKNQSLLQEEQSEKA